MTNIFLFTVHLKNRGEGTQGTKQKILTESENVEGASERS